MKKRIISSILVLVMLIGIMPGFSVANAATSGTTGSCKWSLSGKVLTISGNGKMSDYYWENETPWGNKITKVIIKDGVTHIGEFAFYCCESLTSVVIGNSVTSIGDYAFYDCLALTSIEIPNSVTTIGLGAFCWCSSLTSVEIPDSVTSIGEDAFSCCESLTSIQVSKQNRKYISENGVLFNKDKTTLICCPAQKSGEYIIPDSVTSFEDSAFSLCTSLTSIVIGNSVTSIGYGAFSSCTSLTSVVIGDSVTYIGSSAFEDCKLLTNVIIPNSVTSIGSYAFSCCTSLTSVVIPNSVTSIGYSAFEECSSLTSVEIGNSVTSIGDSAFEDCRILESIDIPDSVTYIGDSAFENCRILESIDIPDSVTYIGDSAFYFCSSLASVVIPDSITSIESSVFENCSSLTSIIIPNSVTSIGSYAFETCSSLTSIVIPNSVTSIGSYAFSYCTSLTSIIIPNSVTSIGSSAFSSCSSLTSVVIPNSVISIGYGAFSSCYLENVYYTGSEADKANISIGSYNSSVTNATWHYNCIIKDGHVYDDVDDTTCNLCEFIREIIRPEIECVSVTLNNSLAYKVKVSGIEDPEYARLIFTVGDKTYTVKNHTIQDGLYVYTLENIAPHLMTEEITAKIIVSDGSVDLYNDTFVTSLEQYCLAVAQADSSYKDIVNAILNYGAAAQGYKNYKLDTLANRTLTESEKEITKSKYFNGLDKEYIKSANSTVNWKSAGLYLDTKATMKFSFETDQDLDGVSVLVENEWFETISTLENCIIKENGKYVFYFSDFNIDELDEIFLFTICKDGKPISDTLSYSVESYAYRADSTDDSNLINLMSALMNYGAIAQNY